MQTFLPCFWCPLTYASSSPLLTVRHYPCIYEVSDATHEVRMRALDWHRVDSKSHQGFEMRMLPKGMKETREQYQPQWGVVGCPFTQLNVFFLQKSNLIKLIYWPDLINHRKEDVKSAGQSFWPLTGLASLQSDLHPCPLDWRLPKHHSHSRHSPGRLLATHKAHRSR